MAAIPPIPQLPPAPSRSQGQAAFNLTADPFIAALPPMVVNINSRLVSIGEFVTAAEGYKTAAASSAAAADESAKAAAKSAGDATSNGAAQVDLAKNQVTLATQQAQLADSARSEAQTAAEAAGAAAGLPPERTPFTFLKIFPDGKSGWGSRDRVGEVVTAVSAQDGSYIQTGGVYLQASYPELFQLLGTIATPGVYSFQGVTNTSGYTITDLDTDGNGVWVAAVSNVTGTSTNMVGYVLRSVDNGVTWNPVAITRLKNSKVRYASGIWVCVGQSYSDTNTYKHYSYSTDSGATWSIAKQMAGGSISSSEPGYLDTADTGELVVLAPFKNSTNNNYTFWTSRFIPANAGSSGDWSDYINVGAPFVQTTTLTAQGLVNLGTSALVYGLSGGLTKLTVTATGTGSGTVVKSGTVNDLKGGATKDGTILIVGSGGTVIRSTDKGASFLSSAVNGTPDFTSVEGVGGGVWLLGTADGVIWISTDDGFTVTKTTPSGLSTPIRNLVHGKGVVALASNATIRRSESLYSYDQTTQFIVPAVPVPSGLKSFIKARAAA